MHICPSSGAPWYYRAISNGPSQDQEALQVLKEGQGLEKTAPPIADHTTPENARMVLHQIRQLNQPLSSYDLLIQAVSQGFIELTSSLLAARANVHLCDELGATAFSRALSLAGPDSTFSEETKKMIYLLHSAGADMNALQPKPLTTVLHFAIRNLSTPQVLQWIAGGADVNKPDFTGNTPLMCAVTVRKEDPEVVVGALLQAQADPNAVDENSRSVLHHLCTFSTAPNARLVSLLCQYGSDVEIKDWRGYIPAHFVKNQEILSILYDAQERQQEAHKALLNLPQKPAFPRYRYCCLDQQSLNGLSQNHRDCWNKILNFLTRSDLSRVDSLNRNYAATTGEGWLDLLDRECKRVKGSPLLTLELKSKYAKRVYKEVVLLKQPLNRAGYIEHVVAKGFKYLLYALVRIETPVNGCNETGTAPVLRLAQAREKNAPILTRLLVSAKANLDERDRSGRTALIRAAQTNFAVVKVLMQARANPYLLDYEKKGLLHYAESSGHLEDARVLLEQYQAAGAAQNKRKLGFDPALSNKRTIR